MTGESINMMMSKDTSWFKFLIGIQSAVSVKTCNLAVEN